MTKTPGIDTTPHVLSLGSLFSSPTSPIPQELLADLASTVAEKKGKLFVHCEAGVNRSGALCLAYHLSSSQMGLVKSAKHCHRAALRVQDADKDMNCT